jgi:hypothetical protein
VRLHWDRRERLHRRDVDDGSTRASEVLEDGPTGVEGAKKIDVNDRLEPVG